MTEQNARGRAYDPQMRTLARLMYNASTLQVSSFMFNRSEVILMTNKQPDAAESTHLAPLCYAGR